MVSIKEFLAKQDINNIQTYWLGVVSLQKNSGWIGELQREVDAHGDDVVGGVLRGWVAV